MTADEQYELLTRGAVDFQIAAPLGIGFEPDRAIKRGDEPFARRIERRAAGLGQLEPQIFERDRARQRCGRYHSSGGRGRGGGARRLADLRRAGPGGSFGEPGAILRLCSRTERGFAGCFWRKRQRELTAQYRQLGFPARAIAGLATGFNFGESGLEFPSSPEQVFQEPIILRRDLVSGKRHQEAKGECCGERGGFAHRRALRRRWTPVTLDSSARS